jgi:hypothetical protein
MTAKEAIDFLKEWHKEEDVLVWTAFSVGDVEHYADKLGKSADEVWDAVCGDADNAMDTAISNINEWIEISVDNAFGETE